MIEGNEQNNNTDVSGVGKQEGIGVSVWKSTTISLFYQNTLHNEEEVIII